MTIYCPKCGRTCLSEHTGPSGEKRVICDDCDFSFVPGKDTTQAAYVPGQHPNDEETTCPPKD